DTPEERIRLLPVLESLMEHLCEGALAGDPVGTNQVIDPREAAGLPDFFDVAEISEVSDLP
ncbi:MAG: hypothetical protein R6T83_00150, partial [Salinibacter sp.]